jgi:N-methylhydantoinase A
VKRLALDIGGTFTNVVYRDAGGTMESTKVPTALEDVTLDDFAGIATLNSPRSLTAFVHETTIVLNAILGRKTPPVELITTNGFRYVLEITHSNRPTCTTSNGSSSCRS